MLPRKLDQEIRCTFVETGKMQQRTFTHPESKEINAHRFFGPRKKCVNRADKIFKRIGNANLIGFAV